MTLALQRLEAELSVGLMVKWDIRGDLESGRLEPVLEAFVAEQINLYAVDAGDTPNRRVSAFIEFLASSLTDEKLTAIG